MRHFRRGPGAKQEPWRKEAEVQNARAFAHVRTVANPDRTRGIHLARRGGLVMDFTPRYTVREQQMGDTVAALLWAVSAAVTAALAVWSTASLPVG